LERSVKCILIGRFTARVGMLGEKATRDLESTGRARLRPVEYQNPRLQVGRIVRQREIAATSMDISRDIVDEVMDGTDRLPVQICIEQGGQGSANPGVSVEIDHPPPAWIKKLVEKEPDACSGPKAALGKLFQLVEEVRCNDLHGHVAGFEEVVGVGNVLIAHVTHDQVKTRIVILAQMVRNRFELATGRRKEFPVRDRYDCGICVPHETVQIEGRYLANQPTLWAKFLAIIAQTAFT
jgi:hypothetical protein